MPKITAGILLYRFRDGGLEVFLAHPGGPYWRKKDQGAWTLPKGEIENGEDPLEAARREFGEETGHHPPGPFEALGKARLRSGKLILAWACEGDLDPQALQALGQQCRAHAAGALRAMAAGAVGTVECCSVDGRRGGGRLGVGHVGAHPEQSGTQGQLGCGGQPAAQGFAHGQPPHGCRWCGGGG
ncbi:MAG: NUDIX domain-containing protein [Acidobacteria bacterium]|nr:NUDIX domain-containing protein [Acidobacteriota bacterium]